MTRSRCATFLTLMALITFVGSPADAQQPRLPQPTKEERFQQAFTAGLQAITARKLQRSERLFKMCIQLFPERPVAYYNLACTYSLMKDEQKAVEQLQNCFKHGYRDLAHMSRDMDLDPIRRTPVYRRAMTEMGKKVLETHPEPLTQVPANADKAPVLVWVHNNRGVASTEFKELSSAFASWAVIAPRGQAGSVAGQHYWDNSAEYVITARVRAFLKQNPTLDSKRVFIAGEGVVGRIALSAAVHSPDVFSGVMAAGYGLNVGLSDVDLTNVRAYLVVQQGNKTQVDGGVEARNLFVKAKNAVVLERYKLDQPFTKDRALILRALAWLQGKKTLLPGAGTEKVF